MATDIDGNESYSPTQRLVIVRREASESPRDYLARLARQYGIPGWEDMTVRAFLERAYARIDNPPGPGTGP